ARAAHDSELPAAELEHVVRDFLAIVREHTGAPFPQDPEQQLWGAVAAVFRSWHNERARRYRRLHGIPESLGTAVNVQAMVFGNMGDDCATGVAFTRDPNDGKRVFYGEYLVNAQGEDVVAGIRTPRPINAHGRVSGAPVVPTLEEQMPRAYRELERLAVDLARERRIRREEAIARVDPATLDDLLHPTLDPSVQRDPIARGLPASPGAAVGVVVLSADAAEARGRAGEKVILVRA